MDSQTRPSRHHSFAELLHMSETFLRNREFNSCYKSALKAKESDPNHPAVVQLLAISVTLKNYKRSPNRPDWYRLLSLQPNVEQSQIQNRVSVLQDLLKPSENPYPFADEALAWVLKAGAVLSDPFRRSHFDNCGGTFWTRCPYCFHIFEYENLFEEQCLKCSNVSCRRAYTAVQIGEKVEPLPEDLEKGEYVCTGFTPAGLNQYFKYQGPQTSSGGLNSKANGGSRGEEKNGDFIEISDNEDEGNCRDVKKVGEELNNGEGFVTKRRKMMARTTKKVMGRGVPVSMEEVLMKQQPQQKDEGFGMEQEQKDDFVDFTGAGSSRGNVGADLDLNFVNGDDDIFVGLDADFWQC